MPVAKNLCLLISGGLDSDVLLAEAVLRARRVWPIYIRQGLAWEQAELFWLRRFLRAIHGKTLAPLTVLSVPMTDLYGSHWSTGRRPVPGARTPDEAVYLPGRNLVLSVKAAVFAALNGIPVVEIGTLHHNPFPDASRKFFAQWSKTLSRGLSRPVQLIAPYRALSKVQVIQKGRNLPLHLSFSCIAPVGTRHCGRCNKCAERRRAFRAAGVKDQTNYAKT